MTLKKSPSFYFSAKELNLCNDDDDCEVVIANEYCHMIQPQVTNAIKGVCVPRNCNPAGDCPTLGNPIQGKIAFWTKLGLYI